MSQDNELMDPPPASTGKMISYGFGVIIVYFLAEAYAYYLFYFYEVEMGLPISLVLLAFIIFAIWNMLNDPLIGYLTDKPRKWTQKYGLRFPWIMIGVFPTLLFYFLIYTPPEGASILVLFLWMVIMTCLFDTFYSLFATHYFGTFTNQFRTDDDRRKASAAYTIIVGFGALALTLIPTFFIVYGDRSSWALAMFIAVVVMLVFVLISISSVRESEELKEIFIRGYETAEKVSYFKTLKSAFRQKNFRVIIFNYLLFSIANMLYYANEIYFLKDVLGVPYSWAFYLYIANFGGYIISIPFWNWVAKKLGHVKTFTLGCLLVGVGYLPLLFITSVEVAIIYYFVSAWVWGCYYIMLFPIWSDVFDEFAVKTGKRQEASLTGIRTFFERMALIIHVVIIGVVHILTGYNPDPNAIQTPRAVLGIRILIGLIPTICLISAFFVVVIWYDLKDEKKEVMIAKMKEMKL